MNKNPLSAFTPKPESNRKKKIRHKLLCSPIVSNYYFPRDGYGDKHMCSRCEKLTKRFVVVFWKKDFIEGYCYDCILEILKELEKDGYKK